jgi:ABC-2 type transport system ATP-binding protein
MNQPSPDLAIETHGLRKVFGEKVAVEDLTLEVRRGEVFGFLGPNGAGKTTSVKMLLGLVSPTAGEARVMGYPLDEPAARKKVGFLPEHFRFHDWLTAQEFLELHGELYGLTRDDRRQRAVEMLDLVGLGGFAGQRLRTFSKGMLQRVGLAQALINRPELVFLDEPTSGLDPVGRLRVRDIIRNLREQGTTVFLNSHLLSEVEITCDRVAFINRGKVVRISALKGLMDGGITLEVHAHGLTPPILAGLARWSQDVRADGESLTLTIEGEGEIAAINRYLVEQGVEVYALCPQHVSLEDLFVQVIGTEGVL